LSNTNTTNTGQNKSFTRNLLNLPQVVTVPTGTVTYTYDATGNKLRKVDVLSGVTKTTDYINGIEYDNSTTTIGFIQTEEGKAVPNGTGYDYQYYLSDNVSNTRVTFGTKTGAAVQQQQDDYYPFGMEILRGTAPTPKNEYLYNKKELQEETAEYDFKYRFYDPVIGRFNNVDRLADKYANMTPYQFCSNSPIWLKELDGLEGIKSTEVDDNGNKTITIEKNVIVLTEKTSPKNTDKQNATIVRGNEEKISNLKAEFNEYFNGSDGQGAKNTAGDKVVFKFNVTGLSVDDTRGGSDNKIAHMGEKYGTESGEKDYLGTPLIAPAAIVTTGNSVGDNGGSNGVSVQSTGGAVEGTEAHELGHTFLLPENQEHGSLMKYPPEHVDESEVDEIIKKSYEKKKKPN